MTIFTGITVIMPAEPQGGEARWTFTPNPTEEQLLRAGRIGISMWRRSDGSYVVRSREDAERVLGQKRASRPKEAEPLPVCQSCLDGVHFAGTPDFPYRLAAPHEVCGALDHDDPLVWHLAPAADKRGDPCSICGCGNANDHRGRRSHRRNADGRSWFVRGVARHQPVVGPPRS